MRRSLALRWLACATCFGMAALCGAATLDDATRALERGDIPAAVAILTPLSEGGDTEAMTRLGELFQKGNGVNRDPSRAAALYTRAAAAGNAEAQFNLGNLYLMGEGVPQDDDWAFTFYRQAAAQGHALAIKNVTEFYRAAGMSTPDLSRVPEMTAPPVAPPAIPAANASASTDPPPDAVVGLIPDEISTDEVKAMELARAHGIGLEGLPVQAGAPAVHEHAVAPPPPPPPSATEPPAPIIETDPASLSRGELEVLADAGSGPALRELARRARTAGIPGESRMWLERAARLGDPEAQFELAEAWRQGDKPDEAEAISWYRAAARQGHRGAAQALETFYREAGLEVPGPTPQSTSSASAP